MTLVLPITDKLGQKKDLSDFFLESWIYSASIGVVNQCDAWADAASLEPPAMISLNAAKAELLDLARSQVSHSCGSPIHTFPSE